MGNLLGGNALWGFIGCGVKAINAVPLEGMWSIVVDPDQTITVVTIILLFCYKCT